MTQIVVACIHSTDELLVVRKCVEHASWRVPRLVFDASTVLDESVVASAARTHFGLEAGREHWQFAKPVSLPAREHGRTRALLFTAQVPTDILEDVFCTCGNYEIQLLEYRGIGHVLSTKEAFLVQPLLPF